MNLNILLLCNKPDVGKGASTIADHIEAFEHYSRHRIWLCSNVGHIPERLDLDKFDVIIIHYSLCLLKPYYISEKSKNRLRDYKGLKVVFVQDEYQKIDLMNATLQHLDIDVLFSCFPESEIPGIYTQEKLPRVSKYSNLTGYIPTRLSLEKDQVPIKQRSIDVGYRGRKLSAWYGELAWEKWSIVDKWFEHVEKNTLRVDLSYLESKRIYGDRWGDFLKSCKTTLGVESGASVMDFTGDLEKTVELYELTHPNDSFFDIQKKYLLPHEGRHKLNQISPRCFEAIALKTVLVLYEGEYSGILVPNRHYIMLKKDFSNIQDVIRRIQDDAYLQTMADTAFEEIAMNPAYAYSSFIERVDGLLSQEFVLRNKTPVTTPYTSEVYEQIRQRHRLKTTPYRLARNVYQSMPFWLRLLAKAIIKQRLALKPKCIYLSIKKHYTK